MKDNNTIKPLILRTGKVQIIMNKGTSYLSANNAIAIDLQTL